MGKAIAALTTVMAKQYAPNRSQMQAQGENDHVKEFNAIQEIVSNNIQADESDYHYYHVQWDYRHHLISLDQYGNLNVLAFSD